MPDTAANAGAAGTESRNDDDRRESRRSSNGPTDEGRGVARRLLNRFRGKAEDALAQMADENKELRVDRRELREKLAKFEGADVVVLRGDDLKSYTEFKALGKKPEDLKKELDELPGLRTKVVDTERRETAKTAASHVGWNADTFAAMVIDKRLDVTLVDGKDKDGKAIKVPHVKPAGDDKATPVAATDWVTNNASYMLPALAAKPAASTTATTGTQARTGTQFVEQGGTAQNGTTGTPGADGTKAAPQIPGVRKYLTPAARAAAEKK